MADKWPDQRPESEQVRLVDFLCTSLSGSNTAACALEEPCVCVSLGQGVRASSQAHQSIHKFPSMRPLGNRHNLKRILGRTHIDVQYVHVGGSLLMLDVQTSNIQQVVSLQEPAELLCSCSSQEAGLLAVGLQKQLGARSEDSVLFFHMNNVQVSSKPFYKMQVPLGIVSISISPPGDLVLILCKNRFYLWGVHNRTRHCSQELPDNVFHAAFTTDGYGIVAVGAHYLSVWSICRTQPSSQTPVSDTAAEVTVHKASFKMDPGSARCEFVHVEALHADGSMAALDRDGKLMLFNAGNVIDKLISTRVRYIEARTVNAKVRNATAMAVSAGRIFVAGGNGVKVFSRSKLQLLSSLPPPKASMPISGSVQMPPRASAAWEPQPSATALSVTKDGVVCVRYADQRLVCWYEESDGSWQMLWQRLGAAAAPSAAALCAAQSEHGSLRTLATASADGQVQLWKYAKPAAGTGGALHAQTRGWTAQTVSPPRPTEQPKGSPSVELPSFAPMSVAFSGCGSFLAVGDGAQGGVRMWDAASLQKSVVQSPREGRVSCITWEQSHHASEQILACGTTAGSVHMYGVSVHGIPRLLHKQTAHRSSVVCFCFLRAQQENKLLSFDSDGHVVCTTWTKQSASSRRVLQLSSPVAGAVVMEASRQVALHTHEGHLHMLDDESFEMLASTKLYKQRAATVCSAGDLVFCGHDSGSVSVCDMKTRKVVQCMKCHSRAVTACCIDTQTGQLVTACESEGSTQFWDVTQLLNAVLHSTLAPLTKARSLAEKCTPLEDVPVLTECDSPTAECGPIPSSFSPSGVHQRHKVAQKGMMPTAASMPVWRTTVRRQHSLQCDARERGDPNNDEAEGMSAPLPLGTDSCRISMTLRASVSRQELQRKRAQEHACWFRNNLDDLNAMQHELQEDNKVLRRSLTHVPMSANVTKRRSMKPQLRTIESVSELSNSVKGLEPYDVDESLDPDNNGSLVDRRASAPAPSPWPLKSAVLRARDRMVDCDAASPRTFTGRKEVRHDDSLSSLTMPSPTTMKADLQQITGKSFVSPATVQAVDMDNSSCSVLWNENDAFKNDRSDSSGGRGADSRAMGQMNGASQKMFNQPSPQPLWDVSPDLSHSTERPCLQPQSQAPTTQASDCVSLGPLRNSFSSRSLPKHAPIVSAIRMGTPSTEAVEDSPLLAHTRSSPALSLVQASPLSRPSVDVDVSSAAAAQERSLPAIKVPESVELPAAAASSPVFCRTTRRCLSRKASSSSANEPPSGPHVVTASSLHLSASRGRGNATPSSATSSVKTSTSFGRARSSSAIPKPRPDLSRSASPRSGVLPAASVLEQSSCGSVTVNGMDSLPCSGRHDAGGSDRVDVFLRDCPADRSPKMEGYQAVSCSEDMSGSEGSMMSEKEASDAMSVAFDAYSFSQQLCKRVQRCVRGTKCQPNNNSEAEMRLTLAKIFSDGCYELALVANELCRAGGGAQEDVVMFAPEQIRAWKACRGPTRSSFSSTLRHLEK